MTLPNPTNTVMAQAITAAVDGVLAKSQHELRRLLRDFCYTTGRVFIQQKQQLTTQIFEEHGEDDVSESLGANRNHDQIQVHALEDPHDQVGDFDGMPIYDVYDDELSTRLVYDFCGEPHHKSDVMTKEGDPFSQITEIPTFTSNLGRYDVPIKDFAEEPLFDVSDDEIQGFNHDFEVQVLVDDAYFGVTKQHMNSDLGDKDFHRQSHHEPPDRGRDKGHAYVDLVAIHKGLTNGSQFTKEFSCVAMSGLLEWGDTKENYDFTSLANLHQHIKSERPDHDHWEFLRSEEHLDHKFDGDPIFYFSDRKQVIDFYIYELCANSYDVDPYIPCKFVKPHFVKKKPVLISEMMQGLMVTFAVALMTDLLGISKRLKLILNSASKSLSFGHSSLEEEETISLVLSYYLLYFPTFEKEELDTFNSIHEQLLNREMDESDSHYYMDPVFNDDDDDEIQGVNNRCDVHVVVDEGYICGSREHMNHGTENGLHRVITASQLTGSKDINLATATFLGAKSMVAHLRVCERSWKYDGGTLYDSLGVTHVSFRGIQGPLFPREKTMDPVVPN
ncbi:hypothetical protein F2Q70_00031267 [Brassica cretica]|uniref:Uncharacterized protein n=1 Tax=Brassica cretica TaxID=69181 RepID=A0A8S9FIH0_BRACR|nr:hypothetical protein F2Q70_00031267 [Brassica cretica]